MTKNKHLLINTWNEYVDVSSLKEAVAHNDVSIKEYISDILTIGPFYYYILNLKDASLSNIHQNILSVLGLSNFPNTLQEIMGNIHPDDIEFVIKAEKACIEKIKEIGFQHQLYLKTSYCFRMKVADGSYDLFNHQAIHLGTDDNGNLSTALNIHTKIGHITNLNSHVAVVSGIGPRKDFHQMDLSSTHKVKEVLAVLSKREMEILPLIANGMSSMQIADKLCVSTETIRVHRKNILRKTGTNNSSSLIKRCIESGLL